MIWKPGSDLFCLRSGDAVDPDNFDKAVPAHQVQMLQDGLYDRYDDMRRSPYPWSSVIMRMTLGFCFPI